MTFEPERCGSSLASAASCGDTSGIELLDPEPAASPGDTSAGLIMPAYVRTNQAELVGFVRQYMSFLRPTSLNRMIKATQRPHNKLFNRLYPEILNNENGSYICLSNDLWARGKSQGQIEDAINHQIGPSGHAARWLPKSSGKLSFKQQAAPQPTSFRASQLSVGFFMHQPKLPSCRQWIAPWHIHVQPNTIPAVRPVAVGPPSGENLTLDTQAEDNSRPHTADCRRRRRPLEPPAWNGPTIARHSAE
jgi:hypothetical protein